MLVVSKQAAYVENTDKNTCTPVNNDEFSQVQHRSGRLLKHSFATLDLGSNPLS